MDDVRSQRGSNDILYVNQLVILVDEKKKEFTQETEKGEGIKSRNLSSLGIFSPPGSLWLVKKCAVYLKRWVT